MAKMLGEILEDEGMLVELAFKGKEALQKFRSRDFDLILLDLRMPALR